jgi:hypothetical protein
VLEVLEGTLELPFRYARASFEVTFEVLSRYLEVAGRYIRVPFEVRRGILGVWKVWLR